ncbi:MAG: efflux RND transporter periplasmic adaptor subunit [Anaerolineales bacterium]|nr:efflux RND transporter periplasmic adaptor subunit [Anaerolineales bacterium]
MQHKLPPIPIRVLIIAVIGALIYFGVRSLNPKEADAITASGSIEAVIVNVAPEISGKVGKVNVDEGDLITKDQALLSLDPSLLTAQLAVANAQLDSANAALAAAQLKYDQTLQTALSAQQLETAKDLRLSAPDEFNQPAWYFNQNEQTSAAQTELEDAQAAYDEAYANLLKVTTDLNNANFLDAEAKLNTARATFLVAKSVKSNADNAAEGGSLQKAADTAYNQALADLRKAQDTYNGLLNSVSAKEVEDARAAVVITQQRRDAAYAQVVSLQTGDQSPAVVSAAQALKQAKSNVAQAEASLKLIEAQIAKLNISAPLNGVVLTRNVEPGEFIQAGGTALTMADLNQITITVYVPENLYGKISVGQTATMQVDSFPNETFNATVIWISSQAEFAPRNVQTVEGRSATFYAVKLSVENVDGKLKIGMPADVVFK